MDQPIKLLFQGLHAVGIDRPVSEQQRVVGADPAVSGSLSGIKTCHLSSLLLPVQRRTAGDSRAHQKSTGTSFHSVVIHA